MVRQPHFDNQEGRSWYQYVLYGERSKMNVVFFFEHIMKNKSGQVKLFFISLDFDLLVLLLIFGPHMLKMLCTPFEPSVGV
jgi:hypothetical protein